MRPPVLGALIGALVGFAAVLLLKALVVSSPLLIAILFPGRIFVKFSNGMSPFGHMIFDTLAYGLNIGLYAAIGYGLGALLGGRGSSKGDAA